LFRRYEPVQSIGTARDFSAIEAMAKALSPSVREEKLLVEEKEETRTYHRNRLAIDLHTGGTAITMADIHLGMVPCNLRINENASKGHREGVHQVFIQRESPIIPTTIRVVGAEQWTLSRIPFSVGGGGIRSPALPFPGSTYRATKGFAS
jgi:L-serine deaminase